MSLFPINQRSQHLIEFKAGKCIKEANTIKPDLRKGLIYMDLEEDQLLHFYWKERKSSDPEDDFIIFPYEAQLSQVSECTTGRVYILNFKSSNNKEFYWMQSKDSDKDAELIDRVNKIINDPGHVRDMDFEGEVTSDLMPDLRNMNTHQALSHIMDSPRISISSEKWKQVKTVLDHVQLPENVSPLELDSSTLTPILHHSEIRSSLFPSVSDQERTTDEVKELVRSSAVQERLQKLKIALEQDHLQDVVEILHTEKDVTSFLQAVSHLASHMDTM
ncbi:proteasome complex subunit Rpn13 ubiquitin receptor-domain-containing protein [Pilobolus umbonatus]|nr:proteasome complex subunit Rpn13 ubiquitin receptor-domain-containing protein [Pilobolus umbonatus]